MKPLLCALILGFIGLQPQPSPIHKVATSNLKLLSGPLTPGLYNNADRSVVAPFIDMARDKLKIEIYEMDDPEVRAAVARAMAKGVKVSVVQEGQVIGDTCDAFGKGLKGKRAKLASPAVVKDCKAQQDLVTQVRQKGGRYEPFNKDELCGQQGQQGRCYMHGKMIIVDERLALISTGNFDESNLCGAKASRAADPSRRCNRDYSYITDDREVVQALNEIFDHDLIGRRYDLKSILDRPGVRGKLTVSPYSYDAIAEFLESAQRSILFQNQYVRPDTGLADILVNKARAMEVKIQVADACAFGKVRDEDAYQYSLMFMALEQANAQIRIFSRSNTIANQKGYLHAKAIVIDDERAWMGSVNGSRSSLFQNREFGLFFSDPTQVAALARQMRADFDHPTSQTWRDSLICHNVGFNNPAASIPGRDDTYRERMKQIK